MREQGNTTVLRLQSASYVDGIVNCRFQRSIDGESAEIFPLNDFYYLFFGVGPVSSGINILPAYQMIFFPSVLMWEQE